MLSGNPYGPNYGGVLIHVNYLQEKLAKLPGLQLILILFGSRNTTYTKNNVTYIEIKRMKFAKPLFPIELLYDSYRLKRIIKKINPDIIHLQSTIPLFSLFVLLTEKK